MKHDFFNLKNKVAIVTGGNQGIGKVVAGYLADAGADVVIFDLNDASEVAEKIAEEYGVRTAAFVCNVTDPEDVEKNIQAAAEKSGSSWTCCSITQESALIRTPWTARRMTG